ncbi:MAG: dihydrodipicolinate synthase family protein [Chloroflexota bacterium]
MNTAPMQGVYPILVTPFHEDGSIDQESLHTLIDFNITAGVHGLGVALGSEVFKLTEAERDQVTSIVVKHVNGRVPVVINTGAEGTALAVHYSKRAEALGADALMILPPSFMPIGPAEILDYYQQISAAVNTPIFLQDIATASISPTLGRQITESCEWVQYIKVESMPITAKVEAMVKQAGDVLTVFGGAGGGFFIEEMRRGSVGTMPFCTQPEAFVEIWHLCQAGDEAKAKEIFNRVLIPISRVSAQGAGLFHQVHKELLVHRGIIQSATVRSPAPAIEPLLRQELKHILNEIYPQ